VATAGLEGSSVSMTLDGAVPLVQTIQVETSLVSILEWDHVMHVEWAVILAGLEDSSVSMVFDGAVALVRTIQVETSLVSILE
jgi:hypothetical protein